MANLAARRSLVRVVARGLSSPSSASPSSTSSRFASALVDKAYLTRLSPQSINVPTRFKTSRSGYSPLNDTSPNWSNRPPKETIMLDGCDYEHWLIVMEFTEEPKPSEEEMIKAYVKTLTAVVGSMILHNRTIKSFSTDWYNVFKHSLIAFAWLYTELPGVLWVLPDSYLDVPNKDYGG
ncbi:Multiple organellar RNA editing factor 3, mitochondrial [Linum perenne]